MPFLSLKRRKANEIYACIFSSRTYLERWDTNKPTRKGGWVNAHETQELSAFSGGKILCQ